MQDVLLCKRCSSSALLHAPSLAPIWLGLDPEDITISLWRDTQAKSSQAPIGLARFHHASRFSCVGLQALLLSSVICYSFGELLQQEYGRNVAAELL